MLMPFFCSVIALVTFPHQVFADKPASIELNCKIEKTCISDGSCEDTKDSILFNFEGTKTGLHGEGLYRVKYQNIIAESQNVTQFGPQIWATAQDNIEKMHTLSIADPDHLVWHVVTFGEFPSSQTHFLNCGEL